MFAWQNNVRPELDLPGLDVVVEPVSTGTAKFDLFFNLSPDETGRSVVGGVEYATDLFDRSTVEAIAACFARVVGQIVGRYRGSTWSARTKKCTGPTMRLRSVALSTGC